jgi:protein-disulfide isomerase
MASVGVEVSAEDHVQGPEGAEVTLVEYGDFQCPHCGTAYEVVKELQRHYGKRLRFVYRNFPLVELHPMAEPAAEAAEFAGTAGKFWQMHDALFENQRRLSEDLLPELAKQVGVDAEGTRKAVEEQAFEERIERDLESGEENGVHGTPTYFINGELYEGSRELEALREAIDEAIAG